MDSSNWLAIAVMAIWVVGGLFVAFRMARSGHDPKLVIPLGVLLGPFLAWFATAPGKTDHQPLPSQTQPRWSGGARDVLVGVDGSPQSVSAAKAVVDLLGGSLSSLTLATVLDYEDRGPRSGIESQSAAYAALVDVAIELGFEPTELELLYGPPAQALAEWAERTGTELIVVGARGRGLTERLLGSVATELIAIARVPVLIGPRVGSDQAVRRMAASSV